MNNLLKRKLWLIKATFYFKREQNRSNYVQDVITLIFTEEAKILISSIFKIEYSW